MSFVEAALQLAQRAGRRPTGTDLVMAAMRTGTPVSEAVQNPLIQQMAPVLMERAVSLPSSNMALGLEDQAPLIADYVRSLAAELQRRSAPKPSMLTPALQEVAQHQQHALPDTPMTPGEVRRDRPFRIDNQNAPLDQASVALRVLTGQDPIAATQRSHTRAAQGLFDAYDPHEPGVRKQYPLMPDRSGTTASRGEVIEALQNVQEMALQPETAEFKLRTAMAEPSSWGYETLHDDLPLGLDREEINQSALEEAKAAMAAFLESPGSELPEAPTNLALWRRMNAATLDRYGAPKSFVDKKSGKTINYTEFTPERIPAELREHTLTNRQKIAQSVLADELAGKYFLKGRTRDKLFKVTGSGGYAPEDIKRLLELAKHEVSLDPRAAELRRTIGDMEAAGKSMDPWTLLDHWATLTEEGPRAQALRQITQTAQREAPSGQGPRLPGQDDRTVTGKVNARSEADRPLQEETMLPADRPTSTPQYTTIERVMQDTNPDQAPMHGTWGNWVRAAQSIKFAKTPQERAKAQRAIAHLQEAVKDPTTRAHLQKNFQVSVDTQGRVQLPEYVNRQGRIEEAQYYDERSQEVPRTQNIEARKAAASLAKDKETLSQWDKEKVTALFRQAISEARSVDGPGTVSKETMQQVNSLQRLLPEILGSREEAQKWIQAYPKRIKQAQTERAAELKGDTQGTIATRHAEERTRGERAWQQAHQRV